MIFKRLLNFLILGVPFGSFMLEIIHRDIYSVFLGEKWRVAGGYSQILIPMIAINFVGESLSGVLIIAEKHNSFLADLFFRNYINYFIIQVYCLSRNKSLFDLFFNWKYTLLALYIYRFITQKVSQLLTNRLLNILLKVRLIH